MILNLKYSTQLTINNNQLTIFPVFEKKYILDEDSALKKLKRMAYEIVENNMNEKEIVIAGIEENGMVIARIIQKMLAEISGSNTRLLSIALDKKKPVEISLSESLNFTDKVIIITDDVANSGKTLLYALKPFLDFHPKKIQILVLVERTHKAFSIKPDYVGLSLSTTLKDHIFVEVNGETIKGAWME
jgi:pyrimidine operon attenuation protein/uracil phosphoribosyltransferase